MEHRFVVDVGWTSVRPIRVSQHVSRVTIMAESGAAAERMALSMVDAHPGNQVRPASEMVLDSVVIEWEEGSI